MYNPPDIVTVVMCEAELTGTSLGHYYQIIRLSDYPGKELSYFRKVHIRSHEVCGVGVGRRGYSDIFYFVCICIRLADFFGFNSLNFDIYFFRRGMKSFL